MKKRMFSALLAFLICFSLVPPIPAAAAGTDGAIVVGADSEASGPHWNWSVDGGGGTLTLDGYHGTGIKITAKGGDVHVKLRGENSIQAPIKHLKEDSMGPGEIYYEIREFGLEVVDGDTIHLAAADEGSRGSLSIICDDDPGGADDGVVAGIRARVSTSTVTDNSPNCSVRVDSGADVSVLVDSNWQAESLNMNYIGSITYLGVWTDTASRAVPVYSVSAGGRLDITVNTVEQKILEGWNAPQKQMVTLIRGYTGSSGHIGHVYGDLRLTYGGPDNLEYNGTHPYQYEIGPVEIFEGAYVELHSTQEDKLHPVKLDAGLFGGGGDYSIRQLIRECTSPEYHMNGRLPDTVWQIANSNVAIWADGLSEGNRVTVKNAIIYPVIIPNRPRNVELLSNRDGRVELKPVEAPLHGSMEYGVLDIDDYVDSSTLPAVWQDSTVFEGLTADHRYMFFARLKPLEGRYLTPESGILESENFITVKGPTQVCTLTDAEFRNWGGYLDQPDHVLVGAEVTVQPITPEDKRFQFVNWTMEPPLEHRVEYGNLYFTMPNQPVHITAHFAMKPVPLFQENCEFPDLTLDENFSYRVPAGTSVAVRPTPPAVEKPGQRWTFQNWTVQLMDRGAALAGHDLDFTENSDGTITFIVPELPREYPFAAVKVTANYAESIDPLKEITVRCDSAVLQNKAFDGRYLNLPAGELIINDQPWNHITDQRIKDQVTVVWRDPVTKEPVPVCPGDGITAGTMVLGPVAEGTYEFAVLLDGEAQFTRTVSITPPAAFSIDETVDYGGTQEFCGLKWNVPLQAVFCGEQRLWDESAGFHAPQPLRMTLIARWFDEEGREIPIQRKYDFEALSGPSSAGTFHVQLWYVPYLAALEYLPEKIDFTRGRKVCDLQKTFTTTSDTFVKLTTSDDWYPTQQYGKLRLYATVGKVGDQLYLMSGERDGNRLKAVPITPGADGSLLLGETSAFLVWPLSEYHAVDQSDSASPGWDYVPFRWRISNATRGNMNLWLSRMGFSEPPTGDDEHTIALDPANDYELHWDCFIDSSTMCLGRDAVDGELYFFGYNPATPPDQYAQCYPVYFYWNKDEWVEPPKPENNDYQLLKDLNKEYDGQPVMVSPYKDLMINKGMTDWDEAAKMNGAHAEWQDIKGQPLTNLQPEKPDKPGEPMFIGPSEAGDYQFVIYEWDDTVKEPPKDDPDWKPDSPVRVERLRIAFSIAPPAKTCLLTVRNGSVIGADPIKGDDPAENVYPVQSGSVITLGALVPEGQELTSWCPSDKVTAVTPSTTGWQLIMPDYDLTVWPEFQPVKDIPQPAPHVHTPGHWYTSAAQHWHICTDTDCGAQMDLAPHSFVPDKESKDGSARVCTICGYRESFFESKDGQVPVKVFTGAGNVTVGMNIVTSDGGKPETVNCSATYNAAAAQTIGSTAEKNKAYGLSVQLDNVTEDLSANVNSAQRKTIAEQQKNADQPGQVYNISLSLQCDKGLVPIEDFGKDGSCFIRVPAPVWYTGQGDLVVSRVEVDGRVTAMPQVNCMQAGGRWFVEWKSDSHSTYLLQQARFVSSAAVQQDSVVLTLTPELIDQVSSCVVGVYGSGDQLLSLGIQPVKKHAGQVRVPVSIPEEALRLRVFLLDANSKPMQRPFVDTPHA